jgi:hypothetical protein
MQIYDVTVRFARTIQVREYEPASAEVIVKAQLAEGEQASEAVTESFRLISEQVHLALGLEANTKLPTRRKSGGETVVQQPQTTGKPAGKKAEEKPAPQTPAAQTQPAKPAVSDIPDDGAPATKPAVVAANNDIPGDDIPATVQQPQQQAQAQSGAVGEPINAAELSKWIGEQVRLGKVTSQAVMGLYPKFGVSRFADLKPEKCAEAKAEIEKLISAVPA